MKKVFGLLLTVATLVVLVPQSASANAGLPPVGFGKLKQPPVVIGGNGTSSGSGSGSGTSSGGSKQKQMPPVQHRRL